ncbi:MAG TPA: amidase family protein [Pseudomonadales bacterium]|nr:amidase family protein [Pseudomonadales bacterium]
MNIDVAADATTLADAIRTRRVGALELVDAYLARIDALNGALNAIVTLDAERARTRARAADAALARGESWGPLHGVPFTLKDAHATAGVRTTSGFPPLDHVPADDGTVAARLNAAGGILLGKTNVATLLGDPGQTSNPIFGRTNNPWNAARTPGGSSGGAAAAVAAALSPFDVGTDLAGSIRIPAHFCGVFGFKPTEHRVSLAGVLPGLPPAPSVRLMSCAGPLARSVADLALVYSLIAGPDGRDTEVVPVPIDPVPRIELKDLRIAYAPTLGGIPVAADIRAALEGAAAALRAEGARVEAPALPCRDLQQDLGAAGELIGMMTGAFQPRPDEAPSTLARYLTALHRRDGVMLAWERFFADWDVLLCPPSLTAAFPHCQTGAPFAVDGRETTYWSVNAHTTLFNYTGHPALALPYTRGRDGLPIGVQLVARRFDDARLLGVARAAAAVLGPFVSPTPSSAVR